MFNKNNKQSEKLRSLYTQEKIAELISMLQKQQLKFIAIENVIKHSEL